MLYESEPLSTNSSEDDEEEEDGNIEIRISPQNDNTGKRGVKLELGGHYILIVFT